MWVASQPDNGSTFSFTLPLYSLAKLLFPVITHQAQLRSELALVRIELTPLSKSLRGVWKETCQQSLEVLRRCIFVDKDVVLPPTGSNGPIQTFFVLASIDLTKAAILMDRIREQVGKLPQLKASGTMRVIAEKIPAVPAADPRTVEQQVWGAADYVTEIIKKGFGKKTTSSKKRINSMRTKDQSESLPVNRAKIMVVDDDPDLRQALSLRLRANNFDTVNVCDGYSAIAMAQKEHPHLIILDLGLPAGDGFSVLKNLQEYPALAVIPVIVLTARDPEGNEKRTLESGAIAFFQKPADNEELLGVIRASLQAGWGWGGGLPS